MKRTQLKFESIQQVVGNDDLSVILLTDKNRQRALSLVCDHQMTSQILLRIQSPSKCLTMLPESLVQLLPGQYEMMIYGIHDGQYQVVLSDVEFKHSTRIRMSDAILLSIISTYPLFIEENLMLQQSIRFDANSTGVAIPINTMDIQRLNVALQSAIDDEDYKLASVIRDEINRRNKPEE